jgi:rhodanese-like domain
MKGLLFCRKEEQIVEFRQMLVVATQASFDWEMASNMMTALSIIVVFIMALYRYATATPLEKLLADGTDKLSIQVIDTLRRTFEMGLYCWIMLFFASYLFIEFNLMTRIIACVILLLSVIIISARNRCGKSKIILRFVIIIAIVIASFGEEMLCGKFTLKVEQSWSGIESAPMLLLFVGYLNNLIEKRNNWNVVDTIYRVFLIAVVVYPITFVLCLFDFAYFYDIWMMLQKMFQKNDIDYLLKNIITPLKVILILVIVNAVVMTICCRAISFDYPFRFIFKRKAIAKIIDISNGASLYVHNLYGDNLMCAESMWLDEAYSFKPIGLDAVREGRYVLIQEGSWTTDAWQSEIYQYKYKDIDEIKTTISSGKAIIIDVSRGVKYRNNHIVGSISFPELGEIEKCNSKVELQRQQTKLLEKVRGLKGKKKPKIYVYCVDEDRSKVAAWRLIAMGYINVYQFRRDQK